MDKRTPMNRPRKGDRVYTRNGHFRLVRACRGGNVAYVTNKALKAEVSLDEWRKWCVSYAWRASVKGVLVVD